MQIELCHLATCNNYWATSLSNWTNMLVQTIKKNQSALGSTNRLNAQAAYFFNLYFFSFAVIQELLSILYQHSALKMRAKFWTMLLLAVICRKISASSLPWFQSAWDPVDRRRQPLCRLKPCSHYPPLGVWTPYPGLWSCCEHLGPAPCKKSMNIPKSHEASEIRIGHNSQPLWRFGCYPHWKLISLGEQTLETRQYGTAPREIGVMQKRQMVQSSDLQQAEVMISARKSSWPYCLLITAERTTGITSSFLRRSDTRPTTRSTHKEQNLHLTNRATKQNSR